MELAAEMTRGRNLKQYQKRLEELRTVLHSAGRLQLRAPV
jgi:hypothetical protein